MYLLLLPNVNYLLNGLNRYCNENEYVSQITLIFQYRRLHMWERQILVGQINILLWIYKSFGVYSISKQPQLTVAMLANVKLTVLVNDI